MKDKHCNFEFRKVPLIYHIFKLRLLESVSPQAWTEAKVIPLPKNSKAPFTGLKS